MEETISIIKTFLLLMVLPLIVIVFLAIRFLMRKIAPSWEEIMHNFTDWGI